VICCFAKVRYVGSEVSSDVGGLALPTLRRVAWGLVPLFLALGAAQPLAAQVDPQDELDLNRGAGLAIGSGARALGMGGAFLARADDATAASWNPAGLSYLRRPEFSIVGAINRFDTDREEGDVFSSDSFKGTSPDFLSVAYPFEVGPATGVAQLSFQRTFSFFSGDRTIERGSNPPILLSGSGGFDVLAFATGIQLSHKLRVGGTLNRWLNGFQQERERLERRRTQQEVDFDVSAWNVNLGLIWTPIESLNVGFVGKTSFTADVELSRKRTDFESDDEGGPDIVTRNAYSSDDVELDFPGAVGVGLSWRPRSTLTLSADYTRSFWSQGEVRNYFVLPKEGEPTPPDDVFERLSFPSLTLEDQVDTTQVRIGLEYVVIRGRLKWPLRAGYFNDGQFFRVEGGTPHFNGFTAGTGIIAGRFMLDIAYLQHTGSYRDNDVLISVKNRRFIASLIYRHNTR